ncbi:2-phosphosulfolactate phosphatase [Thermus scotoductus]|uniref:Probable 2-phosphosulfolactate phosphatase n=4 Tax=Bacteria TaxID=2 RepID=A0A430UW10_THESC|nr:2-phosphosulfolactate phosphatase [Thermus scotoductus]RTG92558.1 2-phosphosulfolactate phosphatase [Thermus scotoductus]RTG99856.1 2-phosphosulfolactate phosphatase [Thermus scotoductus]RTH07302.1 2-phosphosulfolactate phosphatase [Thermus scotoductus]RTH09760.1 2-phosphosulfolactate phosphatase [Thermus scotoductus]RTH09847.1 2-phosphosulfolactate phosphatase [Thermus scotoductus]
MRLKVDVLPAEELVYPDVVLVVDVIRSTTTAVAFLEAGAEALYWVPSLEAARAFKDADVLLAGEVGGLKPPGFDLGNSPREALEAPVGGKTVVMSTTNGTKAAHVAARTAKHVLLASLFNAHAAARLARELATEEVAILAAGKEGRVGLDDLYTAGVLAEYLGLLGEVEPEDGARIALAVKRNYQDPLEALSLSAAATALKGVGLEADVPFCAQVAKSAVVPILTGRVGEALIFKTAPPGLTKRAIPGTGAG